MSPEPTADAPDPSRRLGDTSPHIGLATLATRRPCRRRPPMELIDTPLPDAKVIGLRSHPDDRGQFTETFNREKLALLGIDHEFVQDNESVSARAGTVRGIHMQVAPHAQGKLVRVLRGSIADYAVDLRPDSSTYKQSCRVDLRDGDGRLFWIPAGFGHAFCTLEPETVVAYKVTSLYAPTAERSIRWDDPTLALEWPIAPRDAVLSEKDAAAPLLEDVEAGLTW